jgi:hypothetical protein
MSNLVLHQQGQPFQGGQAIFAQVGWVGHAEGAVYGLNDAPLQGGEPGVTPLYIQVGTYVVDDDGNQRWED